MRVIKFRGKSITNGKWIVGCYIVDAKGQTYIKPFKSFGMNAVKPETVGQWTGLLDSEGMKVYEGDIISTGEIRSEIKYFGDEDYPAFDLTGQLVEMINGLSYLSATSSFEVIGNIHDDPELLDS